MNGLLTLGKPYVTLVKRYRFGWQTKRAACAADGLQLNGSTGVHGCVPEYAIRAQTITALWWWNSFYPPLTEKHMEGVINYLPTFARVSQK